MIFYFSATGNSKRVAERIGEATGDRLVSVTQALRQADGPASPLSFELAVGEQLGMVCPVYFWGLPSVVEDFLARLEIFGPRPSYAFSVVTYGTTSGQASRFVAERLAKVGVTLDAQLSVQMPDTWTPMFDLSDPDRVAKRLARSERELDEVAARVSRREKGDLTRRRVPLWAVRAYQPTYERLRTCDHLSVNADACVGCGLCAQQCPSRAIELRHHRPVWVAERCALCLGCLHRCPAHAIRFGDGRATDAHGQYVNPHTELYAGPRHASRAAGSSRP